MTRVTFPTDGIHVQTVQQALGDRIRRLRGKHGWSQEQFAGACGLHRTYMGHVERGEKNVSLSTVVRIARALGIPISRLLDGSGHRDKGATKTKSRAGGRPVNGGNGWPDLNAVLGELRLERKALRDAVKALRQVVSGGGKKFR
jgi:transcriptional regulator with XRE-family HTH domain